MARIRFTKDCFYLASFHDAGEVIETTDRAAQIAIDFALALNVEQAAEETAEATPAPVEAAPETAPKPTTRARAKK